VKHRKEEKGKKRENERKNNENNFYVFVTYGLSNEVW
jgi:hypothetical protein